MLASAIKKIILAIIRVYQVLTINKQPACRFDPSCSHYAIEAIDKHGAIYGSYLTIKRLLRCHPLGEYGYDPIP